MQDKRASRFTALLVLGLVIALCTMRGDSPAWFIAKIVLALIPPIAYWWLAPRLHRLQRLGSPLGRGVRT